MSTAKRSSAVRFGGVVLVTLVALVGAGCTGGDDDAKSTTTVAATSTIPDSKFTAMTDTTTPTIKIIDNDFDPVYVTVKAGSTVTWHNVGRNIHNVLPSNDGQFAMTSKISPDETYSVTLTKPGDYPYYCAIHGSKKGGQNGIIRVVG